MAVMIMLIMMMMTMMMMTMMMTMMTMMMAMMVIAVTLNIITAVIVIVISIIIELSNHKNAKHDCSMCMFCLAVGRKALLLCSGFRLVCEAHRHHYHRCLASSQQQRPDVQGLEPKVAPDFVWWSQLTNHTHNINISESTTQQRQTTAQHSGDKHQNNNR